MVQRLLATLTEAIVASSCHLVDEITVKVDGQGDPKSQSRHHAGGIGINRLIEICAQLCKIFNIVQKTLNILAINTRNKTRVICTSQARLETT